MKRITCEKTDSGFSIVYSYQLTAEQVMERKRFLEQQIRVLEEEMRAAERRKSELGEELGMLEELLKAYGRESG